MIRQDNLATPVSARRSPAGWTRPSIGPDATSSFASGCVAAKHMCGRGGGTSMHALCTLSHTRSFWRLVAKLATTKPHAPVKRMR